MARKTTAPPHVQTTYTERFMQALGLLCTEAPPVAMCEDWLFSDDEELQTWVLNRLRLPWPQGIGAIDAARTLANFPEEGHYDQEARTPLHLTFEDAERAYRETHGLPPLAEQESEDAASAQSRVEALLPDALSALETLTNMASTFPTELSKDHPDVVTARDIVAQGRALGM